MVQCRLLLLSQDQVYLATDQNHLMSANTPSWNPCGGHGESVTVLPLGV